MSGWPAGPPGLPPELPVPGQPPGEGASAALPRHPLLVAAAAPRKLRAVPAPRRRWLRRAVQLISEPRPYLPVRVGPPWTIAFAGGAGGSGRSLLALAMARWLSTFADQPGMRVLLVDADIGHPALDLLAGGGSATDCPRVDEVVLRLGELSEGRARLEQMLWRSPDRELHALFAPATPAGWGRVGVEHLDYLHRFLLQGAFSVLVVDCGGMGEHLGSLGQRLQRFWLTHADLVVVPSRCDPPAVRAALEAVDHLGRESGAGCPTAVALGAAGDGKLVRQARAALGQLSVVEYPWILASEAVPAHPRGRPVALALSELVSLIRTESFAA